MGEAIATDSRMQHQSTLWLIQENIGERTTSKYVSLQRRSQLPRFNQRLFKYAWFAALLDLLNARLYLRMSKMPPALKKPEDILTNLELLLGDPIFNAMTAVSPVKAYSECRYLLLFDETIDCRGMAS
jgi:hypothetical protein